MKVFVLLFLLHSRESASFQQVLPTSAGTKKWTAASATISRKLCPSSSKKDRSGTGLTVVGLSDDAKAFSANMAQEALVQDLKTSLEDAAKSQDLVLFPDDNWIWSTLLSVLGFALNTILGFSLEQLKESSILLFALLNTLLGGNFLKILNYRNLFNFIIMAGVIKSMSDTRRDRVSLDLSLPPEFFQDSYHYMKYATAAYGPIQIRASEVGMEGWMMAAPEEEKQSQASEEDIRMVANYVGVERQDVLYCSAPGGSADLINHFVAVDRTRREVVLSIRGTYTVDGINSDLDAKGVDWYDGKAHGGFAKRATQLLENKQTLLAIEKGFTKLGKDEGGPGNFKVVGHSLGAGIACLVNIAFQSNKTLLQNNYSALECYGYACPPTFTFLENRSRDENLFENCNCYIHQQDTVPFLSLYAGQRLLKTVKSVGNVTKDIWWFELGRIAVGWKKTPHEILKIVTEGANDLESDKGSEHLKIPAKSIVRMRRIKDSKQYDYAFCSRTGLAMLSVNTDFPALITDHFPPGYDQALSSIKRNYL